MCIRDRPGQYNSINPTTDSEVLHDYEYGSFTPHIRTQGGTSNATYSQKGGYYTKIGRMVYVTFFMNGQMVQTILVIFTLLVYLTFLVLILLLISCMELVLFNSMVLLLVVIVIHYYTWDNKQVEQTLLPIIVEETQ